MADTARRVVFADDGVPPFGRLLVRVGRLGLVECSADEVAATGVGTWSWEVAERVPVGVPELDTAEQDFVAGLREGAATKRERPRDGDHWDSPGALPPDPPRPPPHTSELDNEEG